MSTVDGAVADSAADAGPDAMSTVDGAVADSAGDAASDGDGTDAPPPNPGVLCGSTRCDPSKNERCCVGATGGTPSCAASCGPASAEYLCDTSSECASLGAQAICCLNLSAGSACTTGMCTGYVLCSGGGKCPAGRTCFPGVAPLPGGYAICM
jgi:hypothetical protein